jgi:hypothetical protein
MPLYRIENRTLKVSKTWRANTSLEAIEDLGWKVNDCAVCPIDETPHFQPRKTDPERREWCN